MIAMLQSVFPLIAHPRLQENMHRHLSASKKLSALLARNVLQVTLLVYSCCCWNVAASSPVPGASQGVVDNGAGFSGAVQSIAETGLLRSRPTRSLASEMEHPPASFGLERKVDDETDEDAAAFDNYPADSVAAWEQEAEDAEDDVDKRKWGDNKARVWGKRKWGDNRARVWGKRVSSPVVGNRRVLSPSNGEQRTMSAAAAAADFLNKIQAENRKLVDEAMNVSGEKSGKRKWGENKARVWGK
jgi:hypothetical protein